jgi:hypothetical protein
MRAHSSLGERRRAWAGIAYRGVCLSPNAVYLVRKPRDDKCLSSPAELASVLDAPAYAIGQIQNATPTSAMNAPLRTSP